MCLRRRKLDPGTQLAILRVTLLRDACSLPPELTCVIVTCLITQLGGRAHLSTYQLPISFAKYHSKRSIWGVRLPPRSVLVLTAQLVRVTTMADETCDV